MPETPRPGSRGRRFTRFVGLLLAGLLALTLVYARELLTAYHLRRLRSEDDYLLTAVTQEETSIEYAAVRRFVGGLDGKRSVFRHLIVQLQLALNEQAGIEDDTKGRRRYLAPVSVGTQITLETRATLGKDWFGPAVTSGQITMQRGVTGGRTIGAGLRLLSTEDGISDSVPLQEDSPLAALFDLLADEAFADPGAVELAAFPGILFRCRDLPAEPESDPNDSREDPAIVRTLTWRPAEGTR